MRLHNFLNENDITNENIIKSCESFLKTRLKMTDWIYHGTYRFPGKYKVEKNREPRDNALNAHVFMNKLYTKKIGIPLRSASIFCTTNYNLSKSYGTSLCIFPIGSYKVYTNPNIVDAAFVFASINTSRSKKDSLHKLYDNANINIENVFNKNKLDIAPNLSEIFSPLFLANTNKTELKIKTISYFSRYPTQSLIIEGSNIKYMQLVSNTDIRINNSIDINEIYEKYIWPIQKELIDALISSISSIKEIKFSDQKPADIRELMLVCDEYFLLNKKDADILWADYKHI